MRSSIQRQLRILRDKYSEEGFILCGVFGSMARGDEQEGSDIDILYRLEQGFHVRYRGLDALARIDEIRLELESGLGLSVDLADEDCLDDVGRRYVLPERINV